jgi:hypothetical protein
MFVNNRKVPPQQGWERCGVSGMVCLVKQGVFKT